MIGIFDSGAGGIAVAKELRLLSERTDVLFFRDRPGAPYGTKPEDELISLVEADIRFLLNKGADKVLMACCTASTVWDKLPENLKIHSIPIIAPAALRAASTTKNRKIGVIATEATVKSHAFREALHNINPSLTVLEWSMQPLVTMIEKGSRDGNLTSGDYAAIKNTLSPLLTAEIDTLILGCTHFPLIEKAIGRILQGVSTVSSAKEGARSILPTKDGSGRTIYVENKIKGNHIQLSPQVTERTLKWQITEEEE